jgi:hypothetical protein
MNVKCIIVNVVPEENSAMILAKSVINGCGRGDSWGSPVQYQTKLLRKLVLAVLEV